MLERCRARALIAIVVLVALAGACADDAPDLSEFFPPPDEEAAEPEPPSAAAQVDTVPPSTEAPELDLSVAPATALAAVQTFFTLVSEERFEEAYRLLTTAVRETTTIEDFAERYRDIYAAAAITGMTYEIPPPPGPNVAGVEVVLRYESAFFGPIEERVFTPTRREPNWVVEWSADLIFAGLGVPGYLITRLPEVPVRGNIYDRNGVPLAAEGEVAVVGVSLDLTPDPEVVIELLVDLLELEERVVRDLVYQDVPGYYFIPIARLPYDAHPALIAELEQLAAQGILIQRETRRVYPEGTLAAHVVGFMAEVTAEELEEGLALQGYRPGDRVGRDGVEAAFEEALAGKRGGRLTIVGPGGAIVREIATVASEPSRDVHLTIDVRIQRIAEFSLNDRDGAVVVMDPRNGEILALASYPRFDPNAFVRGLTEEEFELYFEDPGQPFVNRPTERLYPPGSTFKVVTLAAGLEAGGYDENSRIDCPAVWTGLGPDVPLLNWKEEDQGQLSPTQALAESCNPVFYEIGAELYNRGEDLLSQFAHGFGFGQSTEVVGLHDEEGVNPGPDWKRINENDFWFVGDNVLMSIGQGFLLATPLQITNAYAALGTNGIVSNPIVVATLRTAAGEMVEEFRSEPIGVLPVSAATLEYLQAATRQVIGTRRGTGWIPFNGSGVLAAGKSGTAEDQGEQEHALFVAYANIPEPSVVATVVLDDGESGADDAGPIVRRLLEQVLLEGLGP